MGQQTARTVVHTTVQVKRFDLKGHAVKLGSLTAEDKAESYNPERFQSLTTQRDNQRQ